MGTAGLSSRLWPNCYDNVEIFVLMLAEPRNVCPSSDSQSERCNQHPGAAANSPSYCRPLRCCRKPIAVGSACEPMRMLMVGSDGKYVYPRSTRIIAMGGTAAGASV